MVAQNTVARREKWARFDPVTVQIGLIEDDMDDQDADLRELHSVIATIRTEMQTGMSSIQKYMMGLLGFAATASIGFSLNLILHTFH